MIDEFLSSFTEDLARPSRFDVRLVVPPVLSKIVDSKTLALRCESATLPGRTLSTSEQKIYGPIEKFPYQSSYEDMTLTFIVSQSMIEKTMFNTWFDYINPTNTWNFRFKEDYVAKDLTITQYDMADNEMQTIKLIDAFPISVNQLDLDWSNDNAYHKLSVTFAYTYWEIGQTAQRNHAIGVSKNNMPNLSGNVPNVQPTGVTSPINLQALLEIGSLAMSSGKALTSGNPYAILGVAGAATSIIPSLGSTKTLSSLINSQGRGVLDTSMDQNASIVNSAKNTISGLSNKGDNFNF